MIRLSNKDLQRLGAATRARVQGDSPTAAKPRRRKAAADGTPVPQGGRHARTAYEGAEVVVEIEFEPRPKERARTFVDERALVRAFASAHGDTRRFMAAVKARGENGEAGIMRSVTPEDTRRYEEAVALVCGRAMAKAGLPPFNCPVDLDLDYRFQGDPATWPTGNNDGDLDNLDKAVLDGMEKGGVFTNDRLVVRRNGVKRCAAVPGITVRVRPAAP